MPDAKDDAQTPPPAEPKGKKKADDAAPEPPPDKLQLTQAELDAKIDKAVKAAEKKLQSERDKEREEAEKKKAEEAGEYKTIAEKEREKREAVERERDAARMEAKRERVARQLQAHLAEHHRDYITCDKYILPLVEFDAETAPEDITKKIKSAAEQYVKDNPRQGLQSGAPAAPNRGKLPAGTHVPADDRAGKNSEPRRYATAIDF